MNKDLWVSGAEEEDTGAHCHKCGRFANEIDLAVLFRVDSLITICICEYCLHSMAKLVKEARAKLPDKYSSLRKPVF